jgi:hypothetical protein
VILAVTSKTITRDYGVVSNTISPSNFTTVATKLNPGIPQHILMGDAVNNRHFWLPNGSYQGQTVQFYFGDPNEKSDGIYIWMLGFRINGESTKTQINLPWYPFYLSGGTTPGSLAKAVWYDGAWAVSSIEFD